jgi:hypothetical protein
MPDDTEGQKALQDIVSMLYATFLRDCALESVLVGKGLLTTGEVDAWYRTLDALPEMQDLRKRLGIVDSEMPRVLERLLKSFEGPLQ